MSAFPKLLEDFHAMILEGDAALAPAIKTHPRLPPTEQLAIYIDGYRRRLTHAIRLDYPALLALTGDKSFDQLALRFIECHPPEGYNLDRYPHAFAAFVQKNLADIFAGELAMLEGAIAEVFIMEESAPLDSASLAALAPEEFGKLVLKPRLASRLLAFHYPVNDWLLAQRAGNIPSRPEQENTFLYLHRHENNVQRAALTAPAYALLERLFSGMPVGEALDKNSAAHLEAWFAEWMAKGFFRQ